MHRSMILFVAAAAFGQQLPQRAEFDAASVKPANPDARGSDINADSGGVLIAKNVTLRELITTAYDIREFQLVGPAELFRTRWDIIAKPPSGAPQTPDHQRQRLQNLLADRFKLAAHREMRDHRVYVLMQGNKKLKLQLADHPPVEGRTRTVLNNGRGHAIFSAATTDEIATMLSRLIDVPVVNRTGLTGRFDGTLDWIASGDQYGATSVAAAEQDPNAPPEIFSAIQEQFGLRLDVQTAPVEMLIIDHVQQATEN
jgi:uncharacterized protein (TIGR03435 family)